MDKKHEKMSRHLLRKKAVWTKVRITKSEISMRTWRSPMSATSQGTFVVILEISLCDISYIIRKDAIPVLECRAKSAIIEAV